MQLIDQRTKGIMEECKARARDAGLSFDNESLEYIVTNRDLLDLSPKVMIPTLYDYWVHDVEVLKEYGKYKAFPHNPYETVINTRPAISFYNDNNPDWLNIMIFYHVLAHIDFFQNNILFKYTWNDDFAGQALADKRLIAGLRSEYGRWVDYAIEFSRSIDNLAGYYEKLPRYDIPPEMYPSKMIEFYFDTFLQDILKLPLHDVYREIEIFNQYTTEDENLGESRYFNGVKTKYPEFESKFKKYNESVKEEHSDIIEFIMDNSPYLNRDENSWMKSVVSIVRNTSLYFAPQIRSKTINEGWASYWHDSLFRSDDRIKGHEVGYARINAGVTSISRVGLNPYAIGLRMIQQVEDMANKGRLNYQFQKLDSIESIDNYNTNTGNGKDAIFELRKYFSDFMLFNSFTDQAFVDKHDLFVTGKRLNSQRGTYEYYVKSRKAEDYKKMLIDSLYHPPVIKVDTEKTDDGNLYLVHDFEGKQLVKQFIADTMMGIEFLWGAQVQLETTEILVKRNQNTGEIESKELIKVLYTLKDKKVIAKRL